MLMNQKGEIDVVDSQIYNEFFVNGGVVKFVLQFYVKVSELSIDFNLMYLILSFLIEFIVISVGISLFVVDLQDF